MAAKKKGSKGNGGDALAPPEEKAGKKTEKKAEAADQPTDDTRELPPIRIAAQYTKDLSFEAPSTPGVFEKMQNSQPAISVNIDVSVQSLQEKTYEVQIRAKADCKADDTIAFILELTYAGVFIINVPDEHLQPVLLVECPRLLFPFARNIIADTTRDGGFPPLMLGPVDFLAMFQEQIKKQQAQAGSNKAGGDKAGGDKAGGNTPPSAD